ncbi:unnamed protein product [Allacma fusca]|uniref:Uncharacterized protein n=1 Tax=Allacma fusca TaxID=39272 RepID=A0A8J2K3N0_9HEXA|nr:unnamed protein product [Allacma fusca]
MGIFPFILIVSILPKIHPTVLHKPRLTIRAAPETPKNLEETPKRNLTETWTFVLNHNDTGKFKSVAENGKNLRILLVVDLNVTRKNPKVPYPIANVLLTLLSPDKNPESTSVSGSSQLIQDFQAGEGGEEEDGKHTEREIQTKNEPGPISSKARNNSTEDLPSEKLFSFINFHANNILQFNAKVNMTQENVTYTVATFTNELTNPLLSNLPGFLQNHNQQGLPSSSSSAGGNEDEEDDWKLK